MTKKRLLRVAVAMVGVMLVCTSPRVAMADDATITTSTTGTIDVNTIPGTNDGSFESTTITARIADSLNPVVA